MTEPTIGLPAPWILKRHKIVGDRFFFFSVSPRTFAIGVELLLDGAILFFGPCNIGWASMSAFRKKQREREQAMTADQAPPKGDTP